jgi:hypothetical protein
MYTKLKVKTNNLIYHLMILLCFFPFLNILRLPIDSQPNALILSFFIIIINYKTLIYHLPTKLLFLILILLVATIVLFNSNFTFITFTSYISYISLCTIPFAVYISLKKINGLSFDFFKKIILIWGLVALIQRFYDTEFLKFLQYRSNGSGLMGRGVNSLAPEPTYYGTVIALFIVVYVINNFIETKNRLWLIFLLIQLFIFSISSTIIAVFLISTIIYFLIKLFNINFKSKLFYIALFISTFFLIFLKINFDLISNTRVYKIINIVLSRPELIMLDQSINERFNHAFFPIVSLYENFMIPMGFDNFKNYIISKITLNQYPLFFVNIELANYNKIMSGYGAAFFELGGFGLLIPIYLYSFFKSLLNKKTIIYIFILLNMLLFTSISLNNALILFVFGNVMYISMGQKNSSAISI